MAKKIVKLTQKDLTERVQKIIEEQKEMEENMDNEGKNIALGKDDQGNFYVIDMDDPENPKLIAKTK